MPSQWNAFETSLRNFARYTQANADDLPAYWRFSSETEVSPRWRNEPPGSDPPIYPLYSDRQTPTKPAPPPPLLPRDPSDQVNMYVGPHDDGVGHALMSESLVALLYDRTVGTKEHLEALREMQRHLSRLGKQVVSLF